MTFFLLAAQKVGGPQGRPSRKLGRLGLPRPLPRTATDAKWKLLIKILINFRENSIKNTTREVEENPPWLNNKIMRLIDKETICLRDTINQDVLF